MTSEPTDLSVFSDPHRKPPLDERLYSLQGEELAFIKSQTGINDDEELKKHILRVQSRAYQIYGYPCIRNLSFLLLRIRLPGAYKKALKLIEERNNALLLDIGCCFGADTRKAVADGWPAQNIIASDLQKDFWDYGHELFRSDITTFPVRFIQGDVQDPDFIAPYIMSSYDHHFKTQLDLESLNTLTPLQGYISAIHTSALFHIFDEEQQNQFAHALASLLSPLPGSVIFGTHAALPKKGMHDWERDGLLTFCHSPESWSELWDGQVFKKGSVQVDATLVDVEEAIFESGGLTRYDLMIWSVTRLYVSKT